MIRKKLSLVLTQEEINSGETIEIELTVKDDAGDTEATYTITYPKGDDREVLTKQSKSR